MSRLSIIIPFLGNRQALEDTLVSVLENRPEDCEVLVVLGEPYDDPYQLSDEVQFLAAPTGRGSLAYVNRGIEASQSPVVHVIACGTTVEEGWADAALSHFDDPHCAAVAPLVLDPADRGRVLAAGVTYTASGETRKLAGGAPVAKQTAVRRVLAPHASAAFYRKSVLEAAGGFAELSDGWAGIDLGLSLRKAGYATWLEPRSRVVASAAPATSRYATAREAECFFWRWAGQFGWLRSVMLHLLLVLGESVRGLVNLSTVPTLLGRAAGFFRGALRRHARPEIPRVAPSRPPAATAMRSHTGGPHFHSPNGNTARVARSEERRAC